MNQREKRLLIAMISVAVVGFGAKYAKPVFIDPLFNTDDLIRRAQNELDDIAGQHDELETALRDKYISYVERTKTTNPDDARDDLYECINGLVRDAKLREALITPKEPRAIEKRSKVYTIQISMSAIGSFRQSIDFIKRFYGIPYIARFNSLKLEPTSARQRSGHDEVKLTGEIEVLVLPDEKLLDLKIGKQPDFITKFTNKQLARLTNWKPFTPYEKPTPTPRPETPRPPVDRTPSPPPPPAGPPEWEDASEWVLRFVGSYGVDEVRLGNIADESTMYVAAGEDLDGGTLILLSAGGVVNFKADYGYYVYPLGEFLSDRIPLEDADDWPEIQVAMLQYFKAEDRRIAIEDAEKEAQAAKRRAMGLADEDGGEEGDEADGEFVGPPTDADDGSEEATSNGIAHAKSILKAMGLNYEGADAGSNGAAVEPDDTVDPDTTSTGLSQESPGNMQPTSPGRVIPNAGTNGSEDIRGRRRAPRSFRSRSTPKQSPAPSRRSMDRSNETNVVQPGSNSTVRKAGRDGEDKNKQTDSQK
ncbi:MAG: hypothetical protein R3E58_03490 [Phycisphaerae bacterium]